MRATLDRFEGDFAVLTMEDGDKAFSVGRDLLPEDAAEGDVLEESAGRWSILMDETRQRAERIRRLAERLFDK